MPLTRDPYRQALSEPQRWHERSEADQSHPEPPPCSGLQIFAPSAPRTAAEINAQHRTHENEAKASMFMRYRLDPMHDQAVENQASFRTFRDLYLGHLARQQKGQLVRISHMIYTGTA